MGGWLSADEHDQSSALERAAKQAAGYDGQPLSGLIQWARTNVEVEPPRRVKIGSADDRYEKPTVSGVRGSSGDFLGLPSAVGEHIYGEEQLARAVDKAVGDDVLYIPETRSWMTWRDPTICDGAIPDNPGKTALVAAAAEPQETPVDPNNQNTTVPDQSIRAGGGRGAWTKNNAQLVTYVAEEGTRLMWVEAEKGRKTIRGNGGRSGTAKGTVEILRGKPGREKPVDQWDRHTALLGLHGGCVLEVTAEGWDIRWQRREDLITRRLPVAPDPNGWQGGAFEKFLNRVRPEQEDRDYLQRIFAYSLICDGSEDVYLHLRGPKEGRSGKTTLCTFVQSVARFRRHGLFAGAETGLLSDLEVGQPTRDIRGRPARRQARGVERGSKRRNDRRRTAEDVGPAATQ